MKNQVDPTQFIITNYVRCGTKYTGTPSVYSTPMAYARRCIGYREIGTKIFDVQTHHTRVKLSESFVMFTYHTQFWIKKRVWWHFTCQFFRWSDSKFSASEQVCTSPRPLPYPRPHFPCFRLTFQVETFTPCLQRRLLTGNPPSRWSASPTQAGGTPDLHPPPPSTPHMPRRPATLLHDDRFCLPR